MSSNLIKLVAILGDGEYHDGDSLGSQLQVTRSAIWKIIKKLTQCGIEIDSVKGKGYALCEPLTLLDPKKIKKDLPVDISVFESLPSTNEYLKTFKGRSGIKVCIAEQQTQGKGRLNRSWHSPFGKNISLSCLYPFQKEISELSGLSLVTSLAVLSAIRQMGAEQVAVKWPNDIIHPEGKLSGNLIEIQAETHGACHAVIGIGINVNMLGATQQQIGQPWTSIRKITGNYIDRNVLCALLIEKLVAYLHRFEEKGFVDFVPEWMKSDCLLDQTIAIKNLDHQIKGVMKGINAQGHLLLQLADGTVKSFSAGDASIVKK